MMSVSALPSILIVDDVNEDIAILNHILKKNYEIHIAKTGESALKMAEEIKPDLILLDIILPDMTGFVVLEKLKQSSTTQGIPVIVITGINHVQYEQKGLQLGAVDYVTKPFHNTVVLARIKTHIQILQYIRTIEDLGLIDSGTGVSNRRGFENQIETEWARAVREKKPLSLLLIDIDAFEKADNGADGKDHRFQAIVSQFTLSLRRPADFLAKLDDRTFAVLLPNTDETGAQTVADDIRRHIMENVPEANHGSLRIGVASMQPTTESSFDGLIFKAQNGL